MVLIHLAFSSFGVQLVKALLGAVEVGDEKPVAIVGTINLSEDTFYRGSFVRKPSNAVRRGVKMLREGADIIDIGAMSTGPTSKTMLPEKELRLLITAIKAMSKKIDAPISVDTQNSDIARAAIEAGASIINDISGLKADVRMADFIAEAGCSTILMATKKTPGDVFNISEIKSALKKSIEICREHHISLNRVTIDPAIGHWPGRLARLGSRVNSKLDGRNYSIATYVDLGILARIRELKIGSPICVSISRKSFIGEILNLPNPENRLFGSLAAAAISVLNGAHVLRTHDPLETLQAALIAEAIRGPKG